METMLHCEMPKRVWFEASISYLLSAKDIWKKKNVAFFTPQPLNDIYWLIIEEKNTWPKASTGSSHVYSLLIKNLLHNWKEKKSKLKKKRKKKTPHCTTESFLPFYKGHDENNSYLNKVL